MMPRLPVKIPRCSVAMISPEGVTRFCRGMGCLHIHPVIPERLREQANPESGDCLAHAHFEIPGSRPAASPRNDSVLLAIRHLLLATFYSLPALIGGWNDSAVS